MLSFLDKRSVLVSLVFIVLGFLIYSNTLNVPFHFDDKQNIVENPNIRLTGLTLKDITRACFKTACPNRPIANLSFALNYYFHQYNNVAGYHAINIVIHIITGILLYFFIKTTLCIPSLRSRYKSPSSIALFAALIWLVHPVQTQSVTYIVQRMNSMAAMFYILSFLLYVKGRLVKENQKAWPWFAGCALAGLLALGSKETAATLPFFILVYEWYFFQDLSKAWLKRSIPYVVCAFVIFGLLAFAYMGLNPLERILSGYEHRDFTLYQRVLTQFRVVIYYVSLLIYPHPSRLNLDHDIGLSYSLIDPITTLVSIAAVLAMVGLAFYIVRKNRLISFSILWFFGNLLIESSVIALEIMFEHRLYLPSMFACLMAVTLAYQCKIPDWLRAGLLCVIIAVFSYWTYERNHVWIDDVALWKDCAQKSKGKARPHNNLGHALAEQGKLDEAIVHYYEAIRLKPDYVKAHNNLGVALDQQGKVEEAIAHFTEALRIKPEDVEAHNNLGNALARQGKVKEAIAHYLQALRINPACAETHSNLGILLAWQGDLDGAVNHFSVAVRIKPDFAKAHYNLGLGLAMQGKLDEAISHYSEALRINPNFRKAHRELQLALKKGGKLDQARRPAKRPPMP